MSKDTHETAQFNTISPLSAEIKPAVPLGALSETGG